MRIALALSLLLLMIGCRHQKTEVRNSTTIVKKSPPKSTPASGSSKSAGVVLKESLGITQKEIKNSRLYSFVCDWYGVPYKYAGCQRSGVDCSCFSNILYEKVYSKKIPRSATEIFSACRKIGMEDAREGDLVFFKISGNIISHVGVYLKKNYFVHASTSKGVVISSINEPYYKKYFYCAGRIRSS